MSRVYLLMKHPPHPDRTLGHLAAGECIGVYAGKDEPKRIAAERNARKPSCLYTVQCKKVEQSQ